MITRIYPHRQLWITEITQMYYHYNKSYFQTRNYNKTCCILYYNTTETYETYTIVFGTNQWYSTVGNSKYKSLCKKWWRCFRLSQELAPRALRFQSVSDKPPMRVTIMNNTESTAHLSKFNLLEKHKDTVQCTLTIMWNSLNQTQDLIYPNYQYRYTKHWKCPQHSIYRPSPLIKSFWPNKKTFTVRYSVSEGLQYFSKWMSK